MTLPDKVLEKRMAGSKKEKGREYDFAGLINAEFAKMPEYHKDMGPKFAAKMNDVLIEYSRDPSHGLDELQAEDFYKGMASELNIDSLTTVELIMYMEEEFNYEIPDNMADEVFEQDLSLMDFGKRLYQLYAQWIK